MEEPRTPDLQAEVDRLIRSRIEGLSLQEALYLLTLLVNRAAAELHKTARAGAEERKGGAEWGRWAALQNAARSLVLQSSSARDLAAELSGRRR